MTLVRGTKGVARHLQNIRLARCLLVLTGIINNSCCSSQILLGLLTRGRGGGGHGSVFSRVHPDGPGAAASTALMGKPVAQPRKSSCLETPPWSQIPDAKSSLQTRAWGKIPAAKSGLAWSRSPVATNRKHHHDKAKKSCSTSSWRGRGSRNPMKCFGDGNALLEGPAHPRQRRTQRLYPTVPSARSHHHRRRRGLRCNCRQANAPDVNGRTEQLPIPSIRNENASTVWPLTFWIGPRAHHAAPKKKNGNHRHGGGAGAEDNALLSRVSRLGEGILLRQRNSYGLRRDERDKARRRNARQTRARARAPRVSGVPAFLWGVWRGLMALEGRCEASWGGKVFAHVAAGALASSHSLVASVVVGLAVWVSCAKRLAPVGVRGVDNKDGWKQVARITAEVAVLWYCHALPHGLGAGRPLRGNFGSGTAGDLVGAMWHFFGQGAFVRLIAASGRLVGINVLEANGLLLALSCLGNGIAGSRMRLVAEPVGADTYQLRGFFSRTTGYLGKRPILSLPFDTADTFLALQGILSATERELVRKNGTLASAFRDYAGQPSNTLDAHSLGALGARNLMGMGIVRARVRMFGRPALSLGWTEKASNMCMVGDPICGSLLQKILDPTCVILKGRGHLYDAYLACVGC